MQLKLDSIARKVIEVSFYALFFLTPLLWNPANSELFELPKMFFVWAITIIIAGTWAVRSAVYGRLIFRHTLLDLPLLLFLLIQIASYAFSIDRHVSLWGYYSRFNGGLLSLISYILLYWAFVSNMDAKKSLFTIHLSLITALLAALYAIPAHFGYDPTCLALGRGLNTSCWSAQFVPTERIFGTLGQPNWLAAWLVALVPLSWAHITNLKLEIGNWKLIGKWKMENGKFMLLSIYCILVIAAITFTRSQSGFLGLAVAAVVFTVGIFWKRFKPQTWLFILSLTLLGSVLIVPRTQIIKPINNCFQILNTKYSILNTDVTPSADIRCIVWKGAIEIWKHYPIFGSGPETFAHTYYNFKPPEHSLTSEWDHLYNKAHNEYLNYLANTGAVGLLAYLILIFASIRIFWDKSQYTSTLGLGIMAGYASILVTNFFGFSVVPTQLLFFLFPALTLTLHQRKSATNPTSHFKIHALTSHFPLLVILLTTTYLLLTTFRYYAADINYSASQAKASDNDYLAALTQIRLAIEKNPGEPVYQNALADIASSIAVLTYSEDATLSGQLAELAKSASDRAVANSPRSINTYKIRSSVFITLAQLEPNYLDKAREALEKAQEFAPTDARIAFNLGLLYYQSGKLDEAKFQFEKALSLRPNYEDARQALEELQTPQNNQP